MARHGTTDRVHLRVLGVEAASPESPFATVTAMSFRTAMSAALSEGLAYPEELLALFDWIEARGLVRDGVGHLFPPEARDFRFDEATGRAEVHGGTTITFFPAEGSWGNLPPDRVHVFGQTGADGSRIALFRDDEGRSRLVHVGSGSGSVWWGCFGEALDFLRLIAIGYDELAFPESFVRPPSEHPEITVHPNEPFREWLTSTYGVSIPTRGDEVCPKSPAMDDAPCDDPFWRFVDANR